MFAADPLTMRERIPEAGDQLKSSKNTTKAVGKASGRVSASKKGVGQCAKTKQNRVQSGEGSTDQIYSAEFQLGRRIMMGIR
jgi:hypothetical protein